MFQRGGSSENRGIRKEEGGEASEPALAVAVSAAVTSKSEVHKVVPTRHGDLCGHVGIGIWQEVSLGDTLQSRLGVIAPPCRMGSSCGSLSRQSVPCFLARVDGRKFTGSNGEVASPALGEHCQQTDDDVELREIAGGGSHLELDAGRNT